MPITPHRIGASVPPARNMQSGDAPNAMEAGCRVQRAGAARIVSEATRASPREETVFGIAADCALVRAATHDLSEIGTLTHATLHAMQGRFGDAAIRKLVLIVGWFASTSLILDGCHAPMPADGGSAL